MPQLMEALQPSAAAAAPPPLTSSNSSPPGAGGDAGGGSNGARNLGPGSGKIGMSGNDLRTPSLPSPGIKIEFHGDGQGASRTGQVSRPALTPHPQSAPAIQQFQSPMRQHKRTPSQHREVKETLNARSEYTNDDFDGRSHHAINQYTIKEEIGRGSYGAVHLAVDQFGNEYAVKEFSKTRLRKRAQSNILRRGPRRLGRFPFPPRAGMGPGSGPGMDPMVSHQLSDQKAEEAKDALFLIREEIAIMKKLNHPNLVSLIEVLDDPEEDSLYMVLEMCKKGVIMKVGLDEAAEPYSEEECRCWFRDLILGIEYLHAQGVVHRDIKPDNLLLTEDDVLKIVDFGVSEMFEKPERMLTAKTAGSPAFLPPELCVAKHGDVSGTAADIWSMGVSLYCLRYGHIPFNEAGVLEMYEAITTQTPELPEEENEHFKDLIMRLMEKNPEKRITMPEIREHPWVTKEGCDPLLSAEENCSDLVDAPNELEVNHAFTRRMSHLLCVMKAISNFKALLPSRSRTHSPRLNLLPEDAADPTGSSNTHTTPRFHHRPKPSMDEQEKAELKKINEQHAARLLVQRMRVLQHRETSTGRYSGPTDNDGSAAEKQPTQDQDHNADVGPDATSTVASAPPVLGIGIGGLDEFGHGSTEREGVVADSPTAVDFNVYNCAFEDEVERIKRDGGTLSGYKTWDEDQIQRGDDSVDTTEGRHGVAEKLKGTIKPNKFADLVARAIQDARERGQDEGEGEGEGEGQMTEGEGS